VLYDVNNLVLARAVALYSLTERALTASSARQNHALALVECQLAALADEPDAHKRRELLGDVAFVLERELRDPDRALTALIEGYREQPTRDAWAELERLAEATGRFAEVADELEQAIPRLP
jgi:hypothetical protein